MTASALYEWLWVGACVVCCRAALQGQKRMLVGQPQAPTVGSTVSETCTRLTPPPPPPPHSCLCVCAPPPPPPAVHLPPGPLNPIMKMNPTAVQMFVAAGGPVTLLKVRQQQQQQQQQQQHTCGSSSSDNGTVSRLQSADCCASHSRSHSAVVIGRDPACPHTPDSGGEPSSLAPCCLLFSLRHLMVFPQPPNLQNHEPINPLVSC